MLKRVKLVLLLVIFFNYNNVTLPFIIKTITLLCTTKCDTTLRQAKSRHCTPRHTNSRHATLRHATQRHAIPRHATLRRITSRHHFIPVYGISRHTMHVSHITPRPFMLYSVLKKNTRKSSRPHTVNARTVAAKQP